MTLHTNQPAMTVGEARKVLWVRPERRPVGELIDEGIVNEERLRWAAANAYNPQLKQAAQVLLDDPQTFAKPAAPRTFVKVISSGRSFSQRRQIRYATWQGVAIGFLFGILFILFLSSVADIITPPDAEQSERSAELIAVTPAIYIILALAIYIGIAVAAVALTIVVMNRVMRHFDKLIDQYRFGQIGEERTVNVIQQALDGNWTAFLNVRLPGSNPADLDIVLVGPAAVFALEVKNYNGIYRNIGADWELQTQKGWHKLDRSPSDQAVKNALRLNDFLKVDGISQYVEKAVVWANPDAPLTTENPTVRVWTLERLRDELGNLPQTDKVAPTTRDQIVAKLSKLCEKQANEQWYAK